MTAWLTNLEERRLSATTTKLECGEEQRKIWQKQLHKVSNASKDGSHLDYSYLGAADGSVDGEKLGAPLGCCEGAIDGCWEG